MPIRKGHPRALPKRRERLRLDDLLDSWRGVQEYHRHEYPLPPEGIQRNLDFNTLLIGFLRAGREHELPDELRDVAVHRISAARMLGDRQWLRKARCGLETGVQRPYTKADIALSDRITSELEKLREICLRSGKPLSWNDALLHLKAKGVLPQKYTKTPLKNILRRLNIAAPE